MRIIVGTIPGPYAIDLDLPLTFGDTIRIIPGPTMVVTNWSIISQYGMDTQYVKTLTLTDRIVHTIPAGPYPTSQEIDELDHVDYEEPTE